MLRGIQYVLVMVLSAWLTACGTDTSSSEENTSTANAPPTPVTVTQSGNSGNPANFTLRLTDAPIDGLVSVVVKFTAVKLKQQSGGWTMFYLNTPNSIDLLQLQGANIADLLINVPASAGDYKELRFFTGSAAMDNYVVESAGGTQPLHIPGGSAAGLKLMQDFTITEGQSPGFIVDFDLRQSVVSPGNSGNYQFKPVMRLITAAGTGSINGTVPAALLTAGTCSDPIANTFNAAYVFTGHNVTPDDINQLGSNTEPFATTPISYDTASGNYLYQAAFLPAGDYTVALTCNTDLEDLEADDNLLFFNPQNVTVLANNTIFL